MSNKDALYHFTRAIASGITLLKISIRSVLPNLYLLNEKESNANTTLVYDGDFPERMAHSYGEYLDRIGYMFNRERNYQEDDEEYRKRILLVLSENSTIRGLKDTIQFLLESEGILADIEIRENHSDFFDGTVSTFDAPIRDYRGTLLFGVNIFITPREQVIPRLETNTDGSTYTKSGVTYYDVDTGNAIISTYPNGTSWRYYSNIYYDDLLRAFRVTSLRFLLNDITAAGVTVSRVVIRQVGAGGSKGSVYEYNRREI